MMNEGYDNYIIFLRDNKILNAQGDRKKDNELFKDW